MSNFSQGASYFLRAVELYDNKKKHEAELAYRERRDEKKDDQWQQGHDLSVDQFETSKQQWQDTFAENKRQFGISADQTQQQITNQANQFERQHQQQVRMNDHTIKESNRDHAYKVQKDKDNVAGVKTLLSSLNGQQVTANEYQQNPAKAAQHEVHNLKLTVGNLPNSAKTAFASTVGGPNDPQDMMNFDVMDNQDGTYTPMFTNKNGDIVEMGFMDIGTMHRVNEMIGNAKNEAELEQIMATNAGLVTMPNGQLVFSPEEAVAQTMHTQIQNGNIEATPQQAQAVADKAAPKTIRDMSRDANGNPLKTDVFARTSAAVEDGFDKTAGVPLKKAFTAVTGAVDNATNAFMEWFTGKPQDEQNPAAPSESPTKKGVDVIVRTTDLPKGPATRLTRKLEKVRTGDTGGQGIKFTEKELEAMAKSIVHGGLDMQVLTNAMETGSPSMSKKDVAENAAKLVEKQTTLAKAQKSIIEMEHKYSKDQFAMMKDLSGTLAGDGKGKEDRRNEVMGRLAATSTLLDYSFDGMELVKQFGFLQEAAKIQTAYEAKYGKPTGVADYVYGVIAAMNKIPSDERGLEAMAVINKQFDIVKQKLNGDAELATAMFLEHPDPVSFFSRYASNEQDLYDLLNANKHYVTTMQSIRG